MQIDIKLTSKDMALTVCFTALYAASCLLPTFPLVGLPGNIPSAAFVAPVIGMVLGARLGLLTTFLGGTIGFFSGHFLPPSFVSGVTTAVFAGMLHADKQTICVFTYLSLLFLFGFYPFVGPVWLYPSLMWFQVIGFLVLVSPLRSIALEGKRKSINKNPRLLLAFFIVSLTSSLAGQIAGSLTFELVSWPVFIADVNAWKTQWQILTWIYPIERVIIASTTSIIAVFLHGALTNVDPQALFSRRGTSEKRARHLPLN